MKEYTQTIPIGKVQLVKEDLLRLVTLTSNQSQDSGSTSSFTISARLPELRISEETLDDFLRHTDLPPRLDNLSIRWINRRSDINLITHELFLQLDPSASQLQVSSQDQTWVLGKCEQLTRFLRSKRPLPVVPGRSTRILLSNPSPFWKAHNIGITLLLTFLSLVVAIVLGVLQLFKK